MDREEIRQHVVDALGVILVDKTVIEDNQTIDSLVLDEEDIDELSKMLQKSGINFKKRAREEALKHSESTTLMALIDHIFLSQH
ncbi:hypothetical protein [Pseudomonas caspiana]|uniref:hypothetical protein n=1 Tax=Pseudomonas caspiana TaxID=1451454 RepID=UPI0032EF2592